jgi:uncharacterized membrane protein
MRKILTLNPYWLYFFLLFFLYSGIDFFVRISIPQQVYQLHKLDWLYFKMATVILISVLILGLLVFIKQSKQLQKWEADYFMVFETIAIVIAFGIHQLFAVYLLKQFFYSFPELSFLNKVQPFLITLLLFFIVRLIDEQIQKASFNKVAKAFNKRQAALKNLSLEYSNKINYSQTTQWSKWPISNAKKSNSVFFENEKNTEISPLNFILILIPVFMLVLSLLIYSKLKIMDSNKSKQPIGSTLNKTEKQSERERIERLREENYRFGAY